jgi:hypothetical protein
MNTLGFPHHLVALLKGIVAEDYFCRPIAYRLYDSISTFECALVNNKIFCLLIVIFNLTGFLSSKNSLLIPSSKPFQKPRDRGFDSETLTESRL